MKTRFRNIFITLLASTGFLAIVIYRITAGQFGLLTSMLSLATISSVLFLVLEASTTFLNSSRDTRNRFRLLFLTIVTLLIGIELFFRFALHERYASYQEQNGQNYQSLYRNNRPSWFHVYASNHDVIYSRAEFIHSRQVNSLGLCEREVAPDKAPNEYRVIALGDSFTEGIGTSYESTWVKVLERHLAERMPESLVTTINAGVSGSDPFFEYILLRERLLPFNPDLVVVAVNQTDVHDVIYRGGMERFRPDGSMQGIRSAPKWEWAYATSYSVRAIVRGPLQYSWLLLQEDEMESEQTKALEKIKSALVAFQQLADENGFELLVVFHPVSSLEVINGSYSYLDPLISALSDETHIRFTDLLDYYSRNKVITEQNAQDSYWPLDGHHNTKGYEAMGNAIAQTMPSS